MARASLLEGQILKYLDPLDESALDTLAKQFGKRASTRITVILPSGKVVADSHGDPAEMDTHVDRPEFRESLISAPDKSIRFSRTLQNKMMYIAVPIEKDGRVVSIVRTALPVDAIDNAISEVQIKILLFGLFIALLAAVISLLVSRRITQPIEEIRKGAERLARADFQFALPFSTVEEIEGLSSAMNAMPLELQERVDTILQQRNEREAVLSSMVEGVIAVDMDERVISMNHSAGILLGCSESETKGSSIQEVVRNPVLQKFVKRALSSGNPVEEEITLYSNGEHTLNGHGTALLDPQGNQIGALMVLNDITRLKKLEAIRRDFVANVTHELKTPITTIKGFVETLRDGAMKQPPDAERFLGIIEKHVVRLEALIEDLLSFED